MGCKIRNNDEYNGIKMKIMTAKDYISDALIFYPQFNNFLTEGYYLIRRHA